MYLCYHNSGVLQESQLKKFLQQFSILIHLSITNLNLFFFHSVYTFLYVTEANLSEEDTNSSTLSVSAFFPSCITNNRSCWVSPALPLQVLKNNAQSFCNSGMCQLSAYVNYGGLHKTNELLKR